MKAYIFLIVVIVAGFTKSDVHKEFITLDWKVDDGSVTNGDNSLGYTFPGAAFPDANTHIPVFVQSYPLKNSNQDFQVMVDNPVFEELEPDTEWPFLNELPDEIEIKKTRLKSGDNQKLEVQVSAVLRKGNKILLLKDFELKRVPSSLKMASVIDFDWESESVLNNGKWLKISTREKGIYKIPYSKLTDWGFSSPSGVSVFGSGGKILSENPGEIEHDDLPQVAVWHGKNNGTDCLFFYAPGTVEWTPDNGNEYFNHRLNQYSDKGYFFLTEDTGEQKLAGEFNELQEEATHTVSSFDARLLYKVEQYNLLQSGKQWFSHRISNGASKSVDFQLSGIESSVPVSVRVNAAARSSAASQMMVSANENSLGRIDFSRVNTSDAAALYADDSKKRFSFNPQGENAGIHLNYTGSTTSAQAWLDFIEINYRRKLQAGDEALFFRDLKSTGIGNILEFSIETSSPGTRVFDVTDVFNVKEVPVQEQGNQVKAKRPADELKEYVAVNPDGSFPEPEKEGEVENQNLHGLATPEYLIISHPNFLNAASDLANYHRSRSGMQVEVVSATKVYNEFSSGNKDATGIRNFIKMFYDRNEGLKYVLLFGDGSYDNKNIHSDSHNFIPAFQSDNSLNPISSFVTDDYFVMLDSGESVYSGSVDLGIGRIPASTTYQANLVVDKIRNYHSPEALGNWRNVVSFIADDEDGNLHMSDSEKLANQVNDAHGAFLTDKIYFDAFQQVASPGGESYPGVTDAINNRVKDGVLVLNYVGHANERFLADEKVLDISHINSWSNAKKLPVFVTATCEFSRFDADEASAGEYILFNSSGGGIGLFSTTRLVFAYSNYLLSRSFYDFVFEKDENGRPLRMGDIMRLAKTNTINTINKRSFSLLADPALELSFPRHKVATTSVNGKDATMEGDTLGALQEVTISGMITDESGNKLENFSGEITPTVYDKEVMMETLGNAGETPMEFKVQENIIYKGLTDVTNGEFSFSFVIPKDISYTLGEGRIMYYADDGEMDAHGVFENFYIGGPGAEVTDNQGPEIDLYLDTEDFVSGDKVSKNSTLLAYLSDENGINTVGSGIGHDITAVLDNDYSNVMVLNNYYQADAGDYKSGTIRYPLRELAGGKHTLKLKAWDVANNSTEVEIEFEVSDDFVISEVTNYPNPVYDYTFFTFEHNQADATLEAMFEVFDQGGRRIDHFTAQVGSSDNVTNPVRWDLSEVKSPLRSGIYLFRVTAQNSSGTITSKTGKIVVTR